MEVLDKLDFKLGFLCHKCGAALIRNEDNNQGGHEQSTRLNAQFRFITDLLPKIDQVVIPDNTFEVALSKATPVVRDALNQTSESVAVDSSSNKPTAVRGLANTGPTSIAVTLTATDGPTAADKAAEQAKREALAAQNQLPAHFTHSTVTGEQILPGAIPTFQVSSLDDTKDSKDSLVSTPSFSGNDGAEIDSYFAQLKAEQAREAVEAEAEELETDDDEDEDGFEDVVPATGSAVGTPASSSSINGEARSLTSVLKRGGESGTSTGAASPVTGPQTPESGRTAKKVRIEEPAPNDEEESEEDVEFEDV